MTNCRCCGKKTRKFQQDGRHSIHTLCIVKHWSKHSKGINASRCHEFKKDKTLG